jgi:hypothetical protein
VSDGNHRIMLPANHAMQGLPGSRGEGTLMNCQLRAGRRATNPKWIALWKAGPRWGAIGDRWPMGSECKGQAEREPAARCRAQSECVPWQVGAAV